MSPRSPSGCLYAVSSITIPHNHAGSPLSSKFSSHRAPLILLLRHHATRPRKPAAIIPRRIQQTAVARQSPSAPTKSVQTVDHVAYSPTAALHAVESGNMPDGVNPPLSTRPPPLELPQRGKEQNIFRYLYLLGRAYGTFYKNGVKAVWYNRKAARLLRSLIEKRVRQYVGQANSSGKTIMRPSQLVPTAASWNLVTRAESEILARNSRDLNKLPTFAILVAVCGEWLPLIVPFIPSVVPGTCVIPLQTEDMRKAAEERRRTSFRKGISIPAIEHIRRLDMVKTDREQDVFTLLQHDQLLHLSTTLGLHRRLWDRVNIKPPMAMLRAILAQRMEYLTQDDNLLLRHGGVGGLSSEELNYACELRGVDVLHRSDEVLRAIMTSWLANRQRDKLSFLEMLFKRPNAWAETSNDVGESA
nr:hypothetical protein CFP56_69635 [Quercus suber]